MSTLSGSPQTLQARRETVLEILSSTEEDVDGLREFSGPGRVRAKHIADGEAQISGSPGLTLGSAERVCWGAAFSKGRELRKSRRIRGFAWQGEEISERHVVMCKPAPPKCGSRNDGPPGHIHLGHSGFNLFVPLAGLGAFLAVLAMLTVQRRA